MTTPLRTWYMAEAEAARRNKSLVKQYGRIKSYALWDPHDVMLEWEAKNSKEKDSVNRSQEKK